MTIRYLKPTGDTSGVSDRTRIQAALTAGESVVMSGQYYLDAGLVVNEANVSLAGTGSDTIINCLTDTFAAVTVGGTYDRRVHVSGFMVQGGTNAVAVVGGSNLSIPTQDVWIDSIIADDQAEAAVLLSNARDCYVDRLVTDGAKYGVELIRQSARDSITNSRITHYKTYGIYHHGGYVGTPAYGGHSLRVTNCSITLGSGDAIRARKTTTDYPGDNLQIRDCILEGNSGYAVNANYSGIGICGCTIESNTSGGILIDVDNTNCYSPLIQNCYFEGNGAADIQFKTANSGAILSPTIMSNMGSGSHAFLSSTGQAGKVYFATILHNYYARSGGSVWYDLADTFLLGILHTCEHTRLSCTNEGSQTQILPPHS